MARMMFTLCTALPLAALAMPAKAQSVADFYRGKTITMAVGTSPGGDYDLRMRMVGRYLGKYIPGNPTVVATNMPGAGQMLVANWLARDTAAALRAGLADYMRRFGGGTASLDDLIGILRGVA